MGGCSSDSAVLMKVVLLADSSECCVGGCYGDDAVLTGVSLTEDSPVLMVVTLTVLC